MRGCNDLALSLAIHISVEFVIEDFPRHGNPYALVTRRARNMWEPPPRRRKAGRVLATIISLASYLIRLEMNELAGRAVDALAHVQTAAEMPASCTLPQWCRTICNPVENTKHRLANTR